MSFYEELTKLNAKLAEFTTQFEACMVSQENKEELRKFKKDTKVKISEYSSSKQINNEKRKIVANLCDAIVLAEDAAFKNDEVANHCDETGCLVDMENSKDTIIEAYDELQTIALISEGKITVGDENFVDGANFDGDSFSL